MNNARRAAAAALALLLLLSGCGSRSALDGDITVTSVSTGELDSSGWDSGETSDDLDEDELDSIAIPEDAQVYTDTDATSSRIYSYLQGNPDHYSDKTWTGEWYSIVAGKQRFSAFGCGICCLANIFSTLTGTVTTPDTLFYQAQELTNYHPSSGVGALSWTQLQTMCEAYGLSAVINLKPDAYNVFQQDVAQADVTIALVCKYDDDTLWYYTKGHYVTLWDYDPDSDTVFVTDSSGLYNRARVQLSDVYAALKSASPAQYLTVYQD